MPGVWHTLDLPLMQDPENHLKMKTAADLSLHSSALSGKIKTAVTHYHTLFSSQDWSLITLKLDTGRTHQIRVHMASTGHPLLGDTLDSIVPISKMRKLVEERTGATAGNQSII